MKQDLISVIIPVYNVEKYINDCIDSVINQSYKNLEIILIDDGSLDNSGKICDDYARKDKRIKVIHQKNHGLSETRNKGLKIAKGKYVSFIDSDDFVSKDFIESLYNNIKKYNADISACGFNFYYENGKTKNKNIKNIKRKYTKFEALTFFNIFGYFNVSVWNKLYKKELFDKYKFPKNKTSEDWHLLYKIIDDIDCLYYDSKIKYYYRQRSGSITKGSMIRYDGIEAAKNVIEYFKQKKYDTIIKFAYSSLMYAYIDVYNQYLKIYDLEKAQQLYRESKKISNKITYRYMKFMKKIQLFIYLNFNSFYRYIIYKKFKLLN